MERFFQGEYLSHSHRNSDCFLNLEVQFSYQESEKWHNLFFIVLSFFVRKGTGLPISMIFFLEAKYLQESDF
jgi:hypothetical protein